MENLSEYDDVDMMFSTYQLSRNDVIFAVFESIGCVSKITINILVESRKEFANMEQLKHESRSLSLLRFYLPIDVVMIESSSGKFEEWYSPYAKLKSLHKII